VSRRGWIWLLTAVVFGLMGAQCNSGGGGGQERGGEHAQPPQQPVGQVNVRVKVEGKGKNANRHTHIRVTVNDPDGSHQADERDQPTWLDDYLFVIKYEAAASFTVEVRATFKGDGAITIFIGDTAPGAVAVTKGPAQFVGGTGGEPFFTRYTHIPLAPK